MRSTRQPSYASRHQRGVTLIVTLIILAVMTLGAIALVRSIDTSNLISGNLAFRQSATLSAEVGVETAVNWLEANRNSLANNAVAGGYLASWGAQPGPLPGQSPAQTWQTYWNGISGGGRSLATDAAGNTVTYVIQRMCPTAGLLSGGPALAGCAYTRTTACAGNTKVAGATTVGVCFLPHYRITVRVLGPRNTVSFVQTVVAL